MFAHVDFIIYLVKIDFTPREVNTSLSSLSLFLRSSSLLGVSKLIAKKITPDVVSNHPTVHASLPVQPDFPRKTYSLSALRIIISFTNLW